jgi:hypothetical protein
MTELESALSVRLTNSFDDVTLTTSCPICFHYSTITLMPYNNRFLSLSDRQQGHFKLLTPEFLDGPQHSFQAGVSRPLT